MSFGLADLQAAVAAAQVRSAEIEQELNMADAHIGDGDTGSMLARSFARMREVDLDTCEDLGQAFTLLAKATLSATGSSLGTLIATALMAAGKETKGRTELAWGELSVLLYRMVEAVGRRGGASSGDKTFLDSLEAIAQATARTETGDQMHSRAISAAKDVMDRFRGEPSKVGRARMYPERSVGSYDPGMLAVTRLLSEEAG